MGRDCFCCRAFRDGHRTDDRGASGRPAALPVRYIRRRTALDERVTDAGTGALDPQTALGVGLKVDADALPPTVIAALRSGQVDLTSPAVTGQLLALNAVVGVKAGFDNISQLTSVGITCALCHSTVDDSVARGIGRRLDGWANRDLNVGAIVSLSRALPDTLKSELRTWGPGKTIHASTRSTGSTSGH